MKTQPVSSAITPHTPIPQSLTLHEASRTLELEYADGTVWQLPLEYLRVYSPSADVQGHSPDERVLQTGKRHVQITALDPVGNYAIQPTFSDGHNSGIYSWQYLYTLGEQQQSLWQRYLDELQAAGLDRDAPMASARAAAGNGGTVGASGDCGSGSCGCGK